MWDRHGGTPPRNAFRKRVCRWERCQQMAFCCRSFQELLQLQGVTLTKVSPSGGAHIHWHTETQQFHPSVEQLRRRKWQPTPVFLPGEFQGQGSLVGCHVWGHTESDTTEVLSSSSSSSSSSSRPTPKSCLSSGAREGRQRLSSGLAQSAILPVPTSASFPPSHRC